MSICAVFPTRSVSRIQAHVRGAEMYRRRRKVQDFNLGHFHDDQRKSIFRFLSIRSIIFAVEFYHLELLLLFIIQLSSRRRIPERSPHCWLVCGPYPLTFLLPTPFIVSLDSDVSFQMGFREVPWIISINVCNAIESDLLICSGMPPTNFEHSIGLLKFTHLRHQSISADQKQRRFGRRIPSGQFRWRWIISCLTDEASEDYRSDCRSR